ncbi:MAG TPA: DUF488 domain-containing protein [Pirellulales bacterium]|nr:DUF488 domain-containing protein [Pirellulales bacterium]
MTTIHTIGHSTRSADEFIRLLTAAGIHQLVDVRQFPGSRKFPHFSASQLEADLGRAGIAYRHARDLGGRRRGAPDSKNAYWRNASFRAFADHMASDEFLRALEELVAGAKLQPTAIMCAEAVPWRCHRFLISDALVARGNKVVHIVGENSRQEHVLNPHASVSDSGVLTYPGEQSLPLFD